MKKLLLFTMLSAIVALTSCSKDADLVIPENSSVKETRAIVDGLNIPDANFKAYLIENFDTNSDGQISTNEAQYVSIISLSDVGIQSLEGIEYFTNLTELSCARNKLTSLDLSNNKELKRLDCSENIITNINVCNNTKLMTFRCENNPIYNLNLKGCTSLYELWCGDNKFTSLDVSENGILTYLQVYGSTLKTLILKKGQYIYRLSTSAEIVYID